MDNTFLPLIFRMRYINRWSLMFNTEQEDLMQHTAECAFLVHFLATIGNRCFEKQYDADKLKNHLPQELRADYAAYLHASELTPGEKKLLKCADKLCAYIKCIYELNAGNKEFQHAYAAIGKEIGAIQSDELQYFLVHCLPAFSLTLDDLQGTL